MVVKIGNNYTKPLRLLKRHILSLDKHIALKNRKISAFRNDLEHYSEKSIEFEVFKNDATSEELEQYTQSNKSFILDIIKRLEDHKRSLEDEKRDFETAIDKLLEEVAKETIK